MAKDYIRADIYVKVKHDKKSGAWIVYNKKFNLSGYGKTYRDARDMFLACMNDALIFEPPKLNNMKQVTVKLTSGEYCFQEVDKYWYDFRVINPTPRNTTSLDCSRKYGTAVYNLLSTGNWQLLGADPTNLTEVEAGEIVEWLEEKVVTPLMNTYVRFYKDYQALGNGYEFDLDGSVASLDSLAASLGISKPYVILKNVEK